MKKKLVSIVLPTHNRASLLPKAIRSCLEQSYKDIEIIVVDDGSADNTEEIVKEFTQSDSRVQYYKKENGGLPNALNFGFRLSKGDLLTWTSDDNLYRENAIETMAEYLVSHTDVDLVNANMTIMEKNKMLHEVDTSSIKNIREYNPMGACFLYRRNVYEKNGDYDENFILAEDYDYWIRAWKYFKIGHINHSLYIYGLSTDTLTNKKKLEVYIMTTLLKYHHGFISLEEAANSIVDNAGGSSIFLTRVDKIKVLIKKIINKILIEKARHSLIGDIIYLIIEEQSDFGQYLKEKEEKLLKESWAYKIKNVFE